MIMAGSLSSFSKSSLAMEGWSAPPPSIRWRRTRSGLLTFTPAKAVLSAAGVSAMVAVFLIQLFPKVERIEIPKPPQIPVMEFRWEDSFPTAKKTDMDRVVRQIDLGKPVAVERIQPPAITPVQEELPPPPRRRIRARFAESKAKADVCSRHGMRRVWTDDRKSWRCRR